jgi:DNA-binding transcriptional MocR family regulator
MEPIKPLLAAEDPSVTVALRGWQDGDGPLYERLAAALRRAVERGELVPGTRLPPERELARQLGLGRNTVAAAFDLLRRDGVVVRRQGSGTIVAGDSGVGMRAAELSTSLQRSLLFRTQPPPGAVDFLGAHAPANETVLEALAEAAAAAEIRTLARRHGYFPAGYPPLRQAIARRLSATGLPTDEEEIVVTTGAQQALSLIAVACTRPGETVVVEDPTFPGAIDAFRLAGARLATVPVDEGGADTTAIAAAAKLHGARVVYVIPSFQNPTGVLMPLERRRHLALLAKSRGLLVVEDCSLAELSLVAEVPGPVAALAPDAPVLTVGSLSKVVWGGLRVGWIHGSRPAIAQLARVKAVLDLGSPIFNQLVVSGLFSRLDEIVDLRREELRSRVDLAARLLGKELPDWSWREPQGGWCLWARLPAGSSRELAPLADEEGIAIVPGSVMSAHGDFDDYVRLPLGHTEKTLRLGITRLARAWSRYGQASSDATRLHVVI